VSAFERASEQVPLWTWLLWLPQLLTCLARPEGPSIKLILQKVARIYPQALHYTVCGLFTPLVPLPRRVAGEGVSLRKEGNACDFQA
jgi:hypothetical protein